jgi:uncharacterized protein YukE
MRVDSGPAGLPYPPGDPTAVRAAAAQLSSAAAGLSGVLGGYSGKVSAALASWHGPASASFSAAAHAIHDGVDGLGQGADHAGRALSQYAEVLEEAQRLARQAEQDLQAAQSAFTAAVSAAAERLNSTAATAAASSGHAVQQAQQAARQAEMAAGDSLQTATWQATNLAEHACAMARQAAASAAAQLAGVAGQIRSMSIDDWVTRLGAAGLPIEIVGLTAVGMAGDKLWNTLSALRTQNWDVLENLDPRGWAEVEKVATAEGEDSLGSLNAMLQYEQDLGSEGVRGLVDAAGGFGKIPPGGVAAGLDVIGKLGIGVGAAGDVVTLADGAAAVPDKVVAGANLAGIGGAFVGTGAGEAVMAMVGVDSVAGWIPVAGQILIGVTAATAAGLYIYEHWSSVEHAAEDVGKALVAVPELELQTAEQLGVGAMHLGSEALSRAEQVGSSLVHTGTHLVSGAVHTAENVLSDLNPF